MGDKGLFISLLSLLLILFELGCSIRAQEGEFFFVGGVFLNTTKGALKGRNSTSTKGKTFFEFHGIPYGKVSRRFQMSVESDGWEGVRDASLASPPCIQVNPFSGQVTGTEDCLTLSVFTPGIPFKGRNASDKLPVLFAIHTEGFATGNAQSLHPQIIMDQNVVLVTPNFRLGPMGFLNVGLESAGGNQGLKDLVLALKWVQSEIHKFGGDPQKVVIDGISTGGYAVSYLTLSPLSKGLFSGAISEGESALCPWTKQTKTGLSLSNAKKLAHRLDCPSTSPDYLVKCLQKIEPEILLKETIPPDWILFDVDAPWFGPSLETFEDLTNSTIFLGEHPLEILSSGRFNPVPLILGANSHEQRLLAYFLVANESLSERLNEEWGRVAPNAFVFEEYARDPCVVSSRIRNFYFRDQKIGKENVEQLGQSLADRHVFGCTRATALLYSKFAPVYLYNFTQAPLHFMDKINWYKEGEMKGRGAFSEGDHSRHLFETPYTIPDRPQASPDYLISERLATLWASFAKNGRPSELCVNNSCQSNGTDEWRPLNGTEGPLKWLSIETGPDWVMREESGHFTGRMEFWASLNLTDMRMQVKHTPDTVSTLKTMAPSPESLPMVTPTEIVSMDEKVTPTDMMTTSESSTTASVPQRSEGDSIREPKNLRAFTPEVVSSGPAAPSQNVTLPEWKSVNVASGFKLNANLLVTFLLAPEGNGTFTRLKNIY